MDDILRKGRVAGMEPLSAQREGLALERSSDNSSVVTYRKVGFMMDGKAEDER